MKLKFVLLLLFVTALASAAAASLRSASQVTALKVQVQKLEAALTQTPQAASAAREEQIERLGAERQAILRVRSEFLKTLKPDHPDVVYLNKKLAAVEDVLISLEVRRATP